ncbi:hypothetical protein CALVIDRAFT_596192 [Calocera viscosa TUFC12733]|uniref:AB hydrolase-1 domain-containing protein n=1 Tax=Calocera viscosa (strain TUFC12733) TaxID=1330018 RepID=A0A167PRZ8_CALVF|nr:hypothetical protein CALVIDRAFT_596192 [Calocera viscosa TUFC12733]
MASSYPPPSPGAPAPTHTRIPTRQLPPLTPFPLPAELPTLPSPPRTSPFPEYVLSTHLTPCARPRASPTSTTRRVRPAYPPSVAEEGSITPEARGKRAEVVERLTKRMWEQWEEVSRAPSWETQDVKEGEREREPQLWAVVNRFLRREQTGRGVTLFLAHSNGIPKETWEPLVGMVLQRYPVDEVLVWETFNHGDAALVNAAHLGDTYDWVDNTRDVLQFLTYHRPLTAAAAPVHLPLHEREAQPRKVIGLGHSYGGEILLRAAVYSPQLFSCLIAVEALAVPPHAYAGKGWDMLRRTTLSRRSVWPSLADARASFLRSPFFKNWHPAVFHAYVTHALHAHPSSPGAVALKQSPYDEVVCYFNPPSPAETWALLPELDEAVELRWVMGRDPGTFTGGEECVGETVWRRRRRASNVRLREAGHFIPQEAPELLAREVVDVLLRLHGPPAQKARGQVQARL